MAFTNDMTDLINKIERRLGTRSLNLPAHLTKDNWAEIIITDSITTFSRYYPNRIQYEVKLSDRSQDGKFYLIDENIIGPDIKILGVRDIAFDQLNVSSGGMYGASNFGMYDMVGSTYSVADIAYAQMRADNVSLFNNGIFVEFEEPNRIRLKSSTGNQLAVFMQSFPVYLLIKHADNLLTISPTMMETFEDLAKTDIATFLYNELKYYEDMETVFANVNIKLDDIRTEADKRQEIVQLLKESYVSAENKYQPSIFCV